MGRIWSWISIMNQGKGSSLLNSRQSSPCLRIRARVTLGSSGPVHRCGLKCLNTTSPRPMGRNWVQWLHRSRIDRYIRGAFLSIIHISKMSGRVKTPTQLLARRKRMSSLRSFLPFLVHTGVWGSRFHVIHKATQHRRCFDHHHKTLLFNRSPDHCILACHTGNSYCATDGYQSHRTNSNVGHTVHLQVRSGSERNRGH